MTKSESVDSSSTTLWRCGKHRIDLSVRPCIMGILNVTPDSFSDGNRFKAMDEVVAAVERMIDDGADIIDVGGESTRPEAPPVSLAEELRRVIPVIERLAGRISIPVSVDTRKAVVAREAIAAGAEIVNDISAMGFDPLMAGVVAASDAGLVLMHSRGNPALMQRNTTYADIIGEITSALDMALYRAESAGIGRERIVIDPGIGFGKSVEGNLEILGRLGEFTHLGRPVLIGPSRKSFIGKILGRDTNERLFGTAAAVAAGLMNGATLFRVHDVGAMRDVVDMTMAITSCKR